MKFSVAQTVNSLIFKAAHIHVTVLLYVVKLVIFYFQALFLKERMNTSDHLHNLRNS
jgi:hypothetical protein